MNEDAFYQLGWMAAADGKKLLPNPFMFQALVEQMELGEPRDSTIHKMMQFRQGWISYHAMVDVRKLLEKVRNMPSE